MKRNNFIDWRIIMSHLKGSATSEEEKLFQAWLKSDPAHENYVAAARQAWQDEINPVNENYENSFQELMADLRPAQPRKRKLRRLLSYAAAACVLGGLFSCYFILRSDSSQEQDPEIFQFSNHIRPGTSKATLVLNNGQKIPLGDSLLQITLDGVEIKDDSTNNLQYYADQAENSLQHNRLIVPRGGEYCVTLSDGTIVWLNSESELRYPTAFSGNIRRVELKGEAYFKVAHNENQPFIVDANGYQVEVLGTEFNLSAYPDDSHKTTTLLRGKVKVGIDRFPAPDTLYPNMQLAYNTTSQSRQIKQVNAEMYGSWRQGHFEFDHTSFGQFLKIVSRWYDFSYQVKDTSLLNYHFTGAFEKSDNIDDLFRILKSSKIPITIGYRDKHIIFDRKHN